MELSKNDLAKKSHLGFLNKLFVATFSHFFGKLKILFSQVFSSKLPLTFSCHQIFKVDLFFRKKCLCYGNSCRFI